MSANKLSDLTITITEIAETYGVKEQTVFDWAAKGVFPRSLRGQKYLWSREAARIHMISSTLPEKDIDKLRAFQKYM